jgi:hypothetical protein
VPSFGERGPGVAPDLPAPIPSYAPTEPPERPEPPGLGFPPPLPGDLLALEEEPPSPGQWSDGTTPPPPGRTRRSRGRDSERDSHSHSDRHSDSDSDSDEIASSRSEAGPRRLPIMVLLVVVLLGGAYLVWSQVLQGNSDKTTTAPPVVRPSASTAATPVVTRTLGPAELAASLKDAHFKHGYEWGKSHGVTPAAQRDQVCRDEALKQRAAGYPWGAHDRAGCLIALAG